MSIIEITVAAFVMALAVLGVLGAMGSSMGVVGHSRQRSSGTAVAQERLERAHNIAYADVALSEQPAHDTSPTHPDHDVSVDGTQYKGEDLVIDLANGGMKHVDDPFAVANTEFTVLQYVTWRDDPDLPGTHDYKRVTVVVKWKFPVHQGTSHTVTQSTFVSNGTVAAPTPPPTTATPTPAPSGGGGAEGDLGTGSSLGNLLVDLVGGNGQCAGDSTKPQISEVLVLSGSGTEQGYLNSTSVEVRVAARDPECHPLRLFMKNGQTSSECLEADAGYVQVASMSGNDPPPTNVVWTIPAGDGLKTICMFVRAKDERASNVWGVNVLLDQTKPVTPSGFQAVGCVIDGDYRTIDLAWSASSDNNFYGYRLYRSIESNAFLLEDQTTALTLIDEEKKNYSSVRYLVRAYDKAGNESDDSTILSYAKNRC